MDALRRFLVELRGLDILLFHLGGAEVTVLGLIKLLLLVFALLVFTRRLDRWLARRLLLRTALDAGARNTVAAIVRYVVLVLGFLAIAQTSGINLTSFNVFAGAVAVGVGFGLQNVVSNFVSGLIIMFERSITVGDHIVIGTVEGEVTEVGARRTTVLTADNVHYIVPNTRFITENVAKLRYRRDAPVPVRVQVTVAGGTDARLARRLLTELAAENPHVLGAPAPQVRLLAYQGGGAMALQLEVWTADEVGARERLASELNFQIGDKFAAHGVALS